MIDSDRNIQVMGILNLNQDSYFAPSRYNMSILDSGADIIDIGAVSTRPGAAPVPVEEEWARLEPVLRTVGPGIPVSLDTTSACIVERACDLLGRPVIVNDISAGEDDPAMLRTVAALGLEYIAMHKRGTPATMQSMCDYDDVVSEVEQYFLAFARRAFRVPDLPRHQAHLLKSLNLESLLMVQLSDLKTLIQDFICSWKTEMLRMPQMLPNQNSFSICHMISERR